MAGTPVDRADGLVECPECHAMNDSAGATWPPEVAPVGVLCRACKYDLSGLKVRRHDGTVACPECAALSMVPQRMDGGAGLQQFDVDCVDADGAKYTLPMIASSLEEAAALVRSEGHTIDVAMQRRRVEEKAWTLASAMSVVGGAIAFFGVFHWVIASAAVLLAGLAMSMSEGRRGRGVLKFAIGVGGIGLFIRLVARP